jgi:hypothetical protein
VNSNLFERNLNMAQKLIFAIAGSCLLFLTAGCEETAPLESPLRTSAPLSATYNSDEAQCRAEARRIGQGHIGKNAAAGGAIGAVGGATESKETALAGALIGAAIGAAVGDSEVKQAQRNYLVQCMQQRGHAVSG